MLTLNDAITAMIPAGKKKNTAKNDISIGINQSPHTSGSVVRTSSVFGCLKGQNAHALSFVYCIDKSNIRR